MTKSYIWPLTNRITHILLILLFLFTYISADDDFLKYHATFAVLFGVVVIFRIFWGYIGPKYSKFKDFNFSKTDLKEYLLSPFSNIKKHTGHNPASSWAIVLMFILGFLAIVSGMLAYGIEEQHGVFSFLYNESMKKLDIFKEIHELLANALVAVIVIHILGALADKFIKHNDSIDSMINGYKTTEENISIKTNIFQKLFSIVSLLIFLGVIFYLVFIDNIFI